MTLKIEPGEFHTVADRFVVLTRCQRDLITDRMVGMEVLRAGLAVGDTVVVQCVNHKRDVLLHEAQWRVTMRQDVLKQTENDRGDVNHSVEPQFTVEQVTEWWSSRYGVAADKAAAEAAKEARKAEKAA